MKQEFKIGQKVKVNSGANLDGYKGATGIITDIDLSAYTQPHIRVEMESTLVPGIHRIWCYPDAENGVKFDVEILND